MNNSQARLRGNEGSPRWLRRIRFFFSFMMVSTLISAAGIIVLALYLRSDALPAVSVSQTSSMYDLHGNLIDAFHSGENREIVPLEKISPHLINATVAIEDKRFFSHFGLDPVGIARALYIDAKTLSMRHGASTLTQQLARNLYLTHERTWTRKLKEALYAVQLELQYSKKEILAMYLNQIYLGHGAYGVEAAAKLYYGKNASELTLAESAMLAGVPKSWKYYSPYMDWDKAKARQRTILQAMADQGLVTIAQAKAASAEQLNLLPLKKSTPSIAPYFQDYVRSVVVNRLGLDEELYESGGLKIYTTLDIKQQEEAEKAIRETLRPGSTELEAALVAIDPRTGYIRAMVGGTDYGENQYNRVFSTTRQPGSSFKAILYLTALQTEGFTPLKKFVSEPTTFTFDKGRQSYAPSNFGNKYFGEIDMREAIARSDNIYAVNTIMEVGADKVIDMARKLGVTSAMDPLPSLALGTFPVSPFEMASAFATIAGGGVRIEPTAVLRIEDADGTVLYEAEPQTERVFDAAHAYVLTELMESVFDAGGTGSRVAAEIKRPVAGKTGTTNTDAWMVGYTPELATAVWVGYDKGRNISSVESHQAAPIFAKFTEGALEAVPPKLFAMPEGVVSAYIDPKTGLLATSECEGSRLETFVAGTEPTTYCSEHGSKPAAPETPETKKKEHSWWSDLKRWWTE
ncbi:transglycosylase domain-containing protein [Paenibacillus turpanensis]|uniref:transglycosylase domain-containing protein n=1 Tax=Paenibacillus turpanensis TaxID=2689078 RepID=UPI00140BAF51|nr:PBP1A family penicillin-binding protein [Paenibacillus turpanensis]